jgi:hypothetical protein
MSVKASAAIWDYSEATGTTLVVMLALADTANDEGVCWPGNEKLGIKCRLAKRTLQEHIGRLIEMGELQVEGAQRGTRAVGGRGKRSRYRITLPGLPYYIGKGAEANTVKGAESRTVSTPSKGATSGQQRVRDSALKGAESSVPHIEPSKNRKSEPSVAPAARARDPIFDALVTVCNISVADLTTSARSPLNRVVKELKEKGATPEEIERRASMYLETYTTTLTPTALNMHWASMTNGGPPTGNGRASGDSDMAKLKASLERRETK